MQWAVGIPQHAGNNSWCLSKILDAKISLSATILARVLLLMVFCTLGQWAHSKKPGTLTFDVFLKCFVRWLRLKNRKSRSDSGFCKCQIQIFQGFILKLIFFNEMLFMPVWEPRHLKMSLSASNTFKQVKSLMHEVCIRCLSVSTRFSKICSEWRLVQFQHHLHSK